MSSPSGAFAVTLPALINYGVTRAVDHELFDLAPHAKDEMTKPPAVEPTTDR